MQLWFLVGRRTNPSCPVDGEERGETYIIVKGGEEGQEEGNARIGEDKQAPSVEPPEDYGEDGEECCRFG